MIKTFVYGAVLAFFVVQTANVPPIHAPHATPSFKVAIATH